jgi:hypothetical protein
MGMVAHQDSPCGKQYHIRYKPKNDPDRWYWSIIVNDYPTAEAMLAVHHEQGHPEAKLFGRIVTNWEEEDV